jgi:O-antigen/teichoic acid export membrane protein
VLLAAASAASIVANYAFLVAAGRALGSKDYGSLAALLGILSIVLIPAGALQMAVSREVSRRVAGGDSLGADAFARAAMRMALLATLPIVALAVLLAVPLARLLNIDSGVVALANLALAAALVFPVAMGALQGHERFHALAAMYVVPFALRLALFGILVAAGYRLGGAVFATVAAALAGTLIAVTLIRDPLRRRAARRPPELQPFLRYLAPVVAGLVGIALLTHVDVLVVKARFSGDEAGAYAAASAFARVGFFLPATILAVLFPRTAARQARGEETEDILGRSLLATAAFCAALALFYAATGVGLVTTTFGRDFAEGGEILAPFAVAIGLFSLAHVLVGYHLSRGETRYAWIVAFGVAAQVAVLALWPTSLTGVVWANVAVGVSLLAAHELLVGSSVPALRAGLRHLRGTAVAARALLPEALLVLLGTAVFVGALTWPIATEIGSTVIGNFGGDATGTVSWLWRLQKEGGYHLFGTTHHTLSGAPFGWEEDNGLNVQWSLPYYPAYLATGIVGEVAAFNLVVLSGYALSGASMYLFTRYLGCAPPVSAWAALAYIVFPAHLVRAEHASLVHLEVFPLLFLALVAAARRPVWPRIALVGVATFGAWLTSGYFGVMALVTVGAFSATVAWMMRERRRDALRLASGSIASALGATVLVWLLTALGQANRNVGERTPLDLDYGGLRPLELVVPAARNIVLGDWLRPFWENRLHGTNTTEISNYLGLLTIALAAAWLATAWRRRDEIASQARTATVGLAGAGLVALLFAAPSPVELLGARWTWTPARVLFEAFPSFRAPSRWTVLIMTVAVALAALGLQKAWQALGRPGRSRGLIASGRLALIAAAMAFTFLELTVPPAESRFRTGPVPPEYALLSKAPSGIVAEYPLVRSDIYDFWQREHGRPLVNGAASGTYANDVARMVVDPRAPGTAERLALLGVRAIVTRPDALDYATPDTPDLPNAQWGHGYALVGRTANGSSIWRVTAGPAPAVASFPRADFADPLPPNAGFVGYPLRHRTGVIDLRALAEQVVRLDFDVRAADNQLRTLRVTGAGGELAVPVTGSARVSALVRVPRGRSRLLLAVDPEPTEETLLLSAPRTERASGEPALRAGSVAGDPGF